MDLEVIGFIRSPLIAPQATFFDGLLAYPYRMYGKKGFDLGILVSESPLSERAHFYIANALLDWLEGIKAHELIVLDGYSSSTENQEAFFIAESEIRERNKLNIEKVEQAIPEYKNQLGTGYVGGIAGALLNEGGCPRPRRTANCRRTRPTPRTRGFRCSAPPSRRARAGSRTGCPY